MPLSLSSLWSRKQQWRPTAGTRDPIFHFSLYFSSAFSLPSFSSSPEAFTMLLVRQSLSLSLSLVSFWFWIGFLRTPFLIFNFFGYFMCCLSNIMCFVDPWMEMGIGHWLIQCLWLVFLFLFFVVVQLGSVPTFQFIAMAFDIEMLRYLVFWGSKICASLWQCKREWSVTYSK